MGIIRAWLAILIVWSHARQFNLPYSDIFPIAGEQIGFHVTLFILLSGFYIQRSIDQLRATEPNWKHAFCIHRLLRILPSYYLMLCLYLAAIFTFPDLQGFVPFQAEAWEKMHDMPFTAASLGFWANNLLLLFSIDNLVADSLHFFHSAIDWPSSNVPASLIITQSWSLSIELICYLLAPLVLTQKTPLLLLAVLAASLMGYALQPAFFDRAAIQHQLPFFLYGALLFRLYGKLKEHPSYQFLVQQKLGWTGLAIVMVSSVIIFMPDSVGVQPDLLLLILLMLCGMCLLPVAALSKGWKYDRLLGEMSYPLYLSHILCFLLVLKCRTPEIFVIAISYMLSVGYSYVTVIFYERPIRQLGARNHLTRQDNL